MALIHGLPAGSLPTTFREFASLMLSKISPLVSLHKYSRVDVVFDRYPEYSIKTPEHHRRASTQSSFLQRIHNADQKLPVRWKNYLLSGTNKEELIEFLYRQWSIKALSGVDLYIGHGDNCHLLTCSDGQTTAVTVDLLACDHSEADIRLSLHSQHASKTNSHVVIKSPDSDVALIALSQVGNFQATFYFETGVKQKAKRINLSSLSTVIGTPVSEALLGLHTFTGCDSVSAFHSKGKKKAFHLVISNKDFQAAFQTLGQHFTLPESVFAVFEQFVCELYGLSCSSVDDGRYRLLCTKALCEQSLPPSSDALQQHVRRANYQAAISRRCAEQYISAPPQIVTGGLWKATLFPFSG